jgi:hypothetical protein
LVALLNRLDMENRKLKAVSRKLDPEKQATFIKKYEGLLNRLDADEVALIGNAVHPTHAVWPVGCWAPKDLPIAVAQTSGRQRLDIHGAIDLETGNTRMLDVPTFDAASTIRLLVALQALYPRKRVIHLSLDNARYHHAKLVQAWLAQPGCRMKLHFISAYCPHLDSIERLWGLMHKQATHNRCHEAFAGFCGAIPLTATRKKRRSRRTSVGGLRDRSTSSGKAPHSSRAMLNPTAIAPSQNWSMLSVPRRWIA